MSHAMSTSLQQAPSREALRNEIRTTIQNEIREATQRSGGDVDRAMADAERSIEQATQAAFAAQAAAQDAAGQPGTELIVTPPAPPAPPRAPGEETIITVDSRGPDHLPPEFPGMARDIAIAFFIIMAATIVLYPIMRAFGRRLERGGNAPAALPQQAMDQLTRIEHTVEAMQIELERVSEAQRFLTKVQAERSQLPPASRS